MLHAHVEAAPSVTEWFDIDQRAVDVFAGVTADFDEKHNDPTWATSGPWGSTILHGMFGLSLVLDCWKRCGLPLATTATSTPVNYGFDRVRFTAPIKVDQRIRGSFDITDVSERTKDSYLVRSVFKIEAEHVDKPCLVADWMLLFVPV
ncbi:MAG: MaoC/PaaZ C-terminal domain-containing protein [Acidimicrobiales bacterium]